MKINFILLLILIFFSCNGLDENNPEEINSELSSVLSGEQNLRAAKIDSFFNDRFNRGLFNGTVLYSDSGKIVYLSAFGFADHKEKEKLKINSQFQLASVSKPITAYAIMLLVESGEMAYTDSIRKYFPEFPYENITINQLLIHRSGLPNYMYFADKYWKDSRNVTITNIDVIDLMIEYEPQRYYLPGKRYNYNNTNYSLLAAIIEKVSGLSYEQFMKERIFMPLGMSNTSVYNKETDPENGHKVKGYKSWRREAENSYLNGVVGDKGIYSTVLDLYRFDQALDKGTLVSKEEMEKAYRLGHEELYDHDNYGYGWRINMRPDSSRIIYHTGWWKGFRAYYIKSLIDKKTIIVLTNKSRPGALRTRELLKLIDVKTD